MKVTNKRDDATDKRTNAANTLEETERADQVLAASQAGLPASVGPKTCSIAAVAMALAFLARGTATMPEEARLAMGIDASVSVAALLWCRCTQRNATHSQTHCDAGHADTPPPRGSQCS